METEPVLRIQPTPGLVELARGTVPVAEINYGAAPRGAVVVLSDDGGIRRASLEVLNSLAELGYVSTAVELGPCIGRSNADIVADVEAVLDHLAARGWERGQMGVIGHGQGAWPAFVAAQEINLGAAVSASPIPADEPPWLGPPRTVRTPWLGLFPAAADTGTPTGPALREDGERVYAKVVGYPGASSTFYRMTHHEYGVGFDAWQRSVEWLNQRVAPRPTELAVRWQQRVEAAAQGVGGRLS